MHRGGGGITILSKFFVSQDRNEKLCKGTLLFCRKFLVSQKKLWIRGGKSRFSVEIFMSHSAKKFREGSLLSLRKFLVSKSFYGWKGGVSRFSVENFWSHSAEKVRGHPFKVSENLGYRKILCIIGGTTFFRRKFLVSQCRKIRGHPFNVSENLGYRKVLCIIGGITFFRQKFFVSQCRKTSWRNALVFH